MGAGGAESAHTPGMVGRERRGGRHAASGACRIAHTKIGFYFGDGLNLDRHRFWMTK